LWTKVGIGAIALAIGFFEGYPLWKTRKIKDFIVFCVLLASGTALSMAQALHMPLPNPLEWVCNVIRPYTETINYLFQIKGG